MPRLSRSSHMPLSRLFAVLCAVSLALGLVPLAPAPAKEHAPDAAETPSVEEMLNAGPYVEGEALVVYRAAEGSANARSLGGDPLAAAGFSVEESWDFSGVDAVAEGDGPAAISALSLDGEAVANDAGTGLDAAAARVTKPETGTAELLAELQATDGVLAVAPNYVHEPIGGVETAAPEPSAAAVPLAADALADADPLDQPIIDGTDVLPVNGSAGAPTRDPLSGLQWALANAVVSDSGEPADSSVDLPAVYAAAVAGKENIVAVLDSGVAYDSADLKGAMWSNPGNIPGVPGRAGTHGYDFIDGDDEPYPEENTFEESHGTHCAGIVAAASSNGMGVSGISPKTKVMALRTNGVSTGGNINDGAILASYEYLLRAKLGGQNVVAASNSWGGALSPVTEYAMNQAGRAGVLTVFAAGNDDDDVGSVADNRIVYGLSDSPYIVMAAATSPQGEYATYTSHGATIVDVAAPGSVALSTVAPGAQTYLPAVANLIDKAGSDAGARSLYYHNLIDFAQAQGGARAILYDEDGYPADDQGRLVVSTGTGLDGRPALKLSITGATGGENVAVTWYITNPFKNMSWDKAQQVRMAALPGVSVAEQGDNSASAAYALPLVLADDGTPLTDEDGCSTAYLDNQILGSTRLVDSEAFARIANQDVLRVGLNLSAYVEDAGGTASITVTDFGMGFATDDQAYDYMSGTSMACPLVAGAVGLLASLYPDDTALELRGRVVGGMKGMRDASKLPALEGNVDANGQPKQTATNGTLDLGAAAGNAVHPNTWGAHEATGADGTAVLAVDGYALGRATELLIDGAAVETSRWTKHADGSQIVVDDASLLDGARHTVQVSDGTASHKAAYTFPLADQRLSFERVIGLPDAELPDGIGFESGVLVAAADRLFCLDSKGRYLYAYDPDGSAGWTECTSPSDAGLGLPYFRADAAVAYADGKLYLTVHHDEETGDPENPYRLFTGIISYDIASDTWDTDVLDFVQGPTGQAGTFFASVSLASCGGLVVFAMEDQKDRLVILYDFRADEGGAVDIDDESDPDGSFRMLRSGRTAPLAAVGDELRFVGFLPTGADPVTGEPSEYTMALGTFDDETFGVLEPDESAPRFSADELDALEGYAKQAVAATGDAIVFTGASADGLGDTYQVDAETGAWTSLGVRAPSGGSAAVSTACFYRGTYYVLAADQDEEGRPITALYRLPDEVALTPNDHTARAQATEGGTVQVTYGALGESGGSMNSATARAASATPAQAGALSQVDHVALGDTVTWTAVPDEGHAFSGWYAEDGSLVSDEARYERPVTADVVLTARFEASAPPVPDPGFDPDPDPPTSDDPSASQGGAKPLASTGDGLVPAVILGVALVSGAVALAACAVRRFRTS